MTWVCSARRLNILNKITNALKIGAPNGAPFLIEKGIFLKVKHAQFIGTFLSPLDSVRHSM